MINVELVNSVSGEKSAVRMDFRGSEEEIFEEAKVRTVNAGIATNKDDLDLISISGMIQNTNNSWVSDKGSYNG